MATDFYSVYTKTSSGVLTFGKWPPNHIYIRRTIIRTTYFDLRMESRTPEVVYIYIRRTIIRTTFGAPILDIKPGDVLRHHVMVDQHL